MCITSSQCTRRAWYDVPHVSTWYHVITCYRMMYQLSHDVPNVTILCTTYYRIWCTTYVITCYTTCHHMMYHTLSHVTCCTTCQMIYHMLHHRGTETKAREPHAGPNSQMEMKNTLFSSLMDLLTIMFVDFDNYVVIIIVLFNWISEISIRILQ